MNTIQQVVGLALGLLLSATTMMAQTTIEIDPPYNPDANENGSIGSSDLMSLLGVFGYDFTPESIFVDGMTLEAYLLELTAWVTELEAQIASAANFGVTDVAVNPDNTLVFTFSDGTILNTPLLVGPPGDSAYEIWLEQGNEGTEEEFLASLVGDSGLPPADGQSPGALLVWDGEAWVPTSPDAIGCLDSNACNFSSAATVHLQSLCAFPDACGICNGPGAIHDCGCSDIPVGDCDCEGNALDAVGVCGGGCLVDADGDGICDSEDPCVGLADEDGDGICDLEDPCIGVPDAAGICNGDCQTDADGDGVCDDNGADPCDGIVDACGVCNGPGPIYDCGCTPLEVGACDCAGNLPNEAGECPDYLADQDGDGIYDVVLDPCLGQSTLLYHDKTYAVVPFAGRCWFQENLATQFTHSGAPIPFVVDPTVLQTFEAPAMSLYLASAADAVTSEDANNDCGLLESYQLFVGNSPYPFEVGWRIEDSDGAVVAQAGGQTGNNGINCIEGSGEGTFEVHLQSNTMYTFVFIDCWGDGWNGGGATLRRLSDNAFIIGSYLNPLQFTGGQGFPSGQQYAFPFITPDSDLGQACGCTDPAACNYNPNANQDDGSCIPQSQCSSQYGFLYNGFATSMDVGLCPAGWKVPTSEDWGALIDSSGGMEQAGGALKAAGTADWTGSNLGATNATGFTALPGGQFTGASAGHVGLGEEAWFWSEKAGNAQVASAYGLASESESVSLIQHALLRGHSIRCVKVTETLGCTDPDYFEFDASATLDDGSCDSLIIPGCTDEALLGYNPEANFDDGSCDGYPGCSSSDFVDYQGHAYPVVAIGEQCWFKQNLRASSYADGSPIPVYEFDVEWGNLSFGAVCDYNNDASIAATYGKLYNGWAVLDDRGLCPAGWHIPTGSEWNMMLATLGGDIYAMEGLGASMPEFSNWDGNNSSGFSALPAGSRASTGQFGGLGQAAVFWGAGDAAGSTYLFSAGLYGSYLQLNEYTVQQQWVADRGSSVRCVADE